MEYRLYRFVSYSYLENIIFIVTYILFLPSYFSADQLVKNSTMSARPRPVTATFKPKSMAPPVGVRTRSYSLSSGSSTESLVSVLGHDSYESLSDVSDEEVPPSDCKASFSDR